MKPEHRTVIDVGTNSIKLLVVDTAGGGVRPVLETAAKQPVRLGRGFYATRRLQPEAIADATEAIAHLARIARGLDAVSLRVIATSAVREAQNADELANAVHNTCGLTLEVISGDREAEWVFRGVTSDPRLAGCPLLIVEVGGGSTEIVASDGAHPCLRRSFDLGALRLSETLGLHDPPTHGDRLRCQDFLTQFFGELVSPVLAAGLCRRSSAMKMVGTGGTASCLANIQAKRLGSEWLSQETARIGRAELGTEMERLWSLSSSERKQIPGLPENRADIILTGAAIFDAAMTHLGFEEMSVSRRGLRFGALLSEMSQSVCFEQDFHEPGQALDTRDRMSA